MSLGLNRVVYFERVADSVRAISRGAFFHGKCLPLAQCPLNFTQCILFRVVNSSVGRYSKFVSKGGITGGKDQLRITGGERATLLPVTGFTVPVSTLTL